VTRRRFRYSPDEKKLIVDACPDTARDDPLLPWHIGELERAADRYLFRLEESKKLPEVYHLRQRREQVLTQLLAVRAMCDDDDWIFRWAEEHETEIWKAGDSPTSFLCKLFLDDRLSSFRFEWRIAKNFIDFLISIYKEDSYDEQLKSRNSRDFRHRDQYIEEVVKRWADLSDIEMTDCKISAVEGSPMLSFVQAATDPSLCRTGEAIGPERMVQLVNKLRKVRHRL
jgi:hypothetical protein